MALCTRKRGPEGKKLFIKLTTFAQCSPRLDGHISRVPLGNSYGYEVEHDHERRADEDGEAAALPVGKGAEEEDPHDEARRPGSEQVGRPRRPEQNRRLTEDQLI